jgi:hypothetical protein
MSRTLTVSDDLYRQLGMSARRSGVSSIEDLLAVWQARADELNQRQQVVQETDALQKRLFAVHGEMPDSTELLREDRER